MNERIRELYKEASEFAYKICREEGREGGTSDHIWNTLSTGKFAELIVMECMEICESGTATQTTSAGAAQQIRQHFGVKE